MAEPLTITERRALNLYTKGKTRKEIVETLGLSPVTIDKAFLHLRKKLDIEHGVDVGQWILTRVPREVLTRYI